jgi:hypothetical protein
LFSKRTRLPLTKGPTHHQTYQRAGSGQISNQVRPILRPLPYTYNNGVVCTYVVHRLECFNKSKRKYFCLKADKAICCIVRFYNGVLVKRDCRIGSRICGTAMKRARALQRPRVARWFVFKPKIPIWVNYGGPYNGKCWYILRSFEIFYCHLAYFIAIW